MKKLFLSILIATGLVAAVWVGAASGGTTGTVCATLGKSEFCGGGTFKPDKLPKKTRVPISLKTWGSVVNDDGSVPPIVDVVKVDFDDDGDVSTKGLAKCDMKKVASATPAEATRVCGKALVGKGQVEATIVFTDPDTGEQIQDPIAAFGPLAIFNGKPKGGNPTVVLHTLLDEPLPVTYVTQAVISDSKKKGYGKQVRVNVPPIVNGQGTFVGFTANVKKKVRGKNYLMSRCSTGTLIADSEITLRGESSPINLGLATKCKQGKEPRGGKGGKKCKKKAIKKIAKKRGKPAARRAAKKCSKNKRGKVQNRKGKGGKNKRR